MRLTAEGRAARRRVPARRHASASGATPTCCACCAAARSPGCGTRSSRSTRPRSAGSSTTWQGVVRRRRGARRAARRDRAAAGRAAAGVDPRSRDPAGARRRLRPADLDALDGAPARSSGSASSRSASATAASRCTSPITCALLRAAASNPSDRDRARRARSSTTCATHGASFFPRHSRGVGGGFPQETVDALWDSSGRGWSPTTRSTRCARSRAPPPRTRRDRQTRAVPLAPRRAARGARPLVAAWRRGSARGPSPTEWATAHRAAAARRATASSRARRWPPKGCAGGFSAVYDVLQGDGGERAASGAATSSPASAPRSSRCRPRSICCARCATSRSAVQVDAPRGDRSGEPVRRHPQVARAPGSAAGWARPDPDRGRHGHPRQRTACRVSWHAAIVSCPVYLPDEEPTRTITAGQSPPGCSSSRHRRRPPRHAHRAHRRRPVAEHPLRPIWSTQVSSAGRWGCRRPGRAGHLRLGLAPGTDVCGSGVVLGSGFGCCRRNTEH